MDFPWVVFLHILGNTLVHVLPERWLFFFFPSSGSVLGYPLVISFPWN